MLRCRLSSLLNKDRGNFVIPFAKVAECVKFYLNRWKLSGYKFMQTFAHPRMEAFRTVKCACMLEMIIFVED